MNPPMRQSSHGIERTYRAALLLYPANFRQSYAEPMLQCLRDALGDPSLPKSVLLRTLLKDLVLSLVKENLGMLRETVSRPTLLYTALLLVALSTAISLGFIVVEQQSLRLTANDPQLGMATDLANRIARGTSPTAAVPDDQTDMDASLSPFVIAYDEQGKVLASSAQLNGTVPRLPQGVLDYVRHHGEERITWAPRRDVRIASIVRHVPGPQGGFVTAGRNLREVEARKDLLLQLTALVWFGLLGIIFLGTFLFGWLVRTPKPAAA